MDKTCPDLQDPIEGMVITNDPSCVSSTIAKYTCNAGFVPKGDTIRCCVAMNDDMTIFDWSGTPPTCVCKFTFSCFLIR